MRSFYQSLAVITTSLSLFGFGHATINSSLGTLAPSCSALNFDDSYFSVVGIQDSGVQTRREIRELEKDSTTWNLFLQALARFQAMDRSQKLSYFQIAGIHGAPFTDWDGAQGNGSHGYCPHLSNLFGTWHRPYLALFEQVLHDRALDIVNEIQDEEIKRQYQAAAEKLRLPYWDWAQSFDDAHGCMPASMRESTAAVTYPNGTNATISNPLYQYTFHPLNSSDFKFLDDAAGFKFSQWKSTIRLPQDGYSANATSRNDEVNARIGAQQPNNRDMLYKLLTVYQPFNEWSNKAIGGKIGNVETLHDGIHNTFGLSNMGITEVSAFDPAFWLHHCNIDRVIALYQRRYPDTFVEDALQVKDTFTMAIDSFQDASTPLAPFHMNAQGGMWDSYTVRNWESFGYTYPELQESFSNDSLTVRINRLYKPETQGLTFDSSGSNSTDNNSTNAQSKREASADAPANADAFDWMAEVNMPTDIQTTYSVRAFIGEPNADPNMWPIDSNYVGQVASLASPFGNSDAIITANIPLTQKLAERFAKGELTSLNKDVVQAYLKDQFHWRIQRVDLTEIDRTTAPAGLNVTVISVPIRVAQSELEVPAFVGDFQYHDDIKGNPPANQTTPDDGAQVQPDTTTSLAESRASTTVTATEDVAAKVVTVIAANTAVVTVVSD